MDSVQIKSFGSGLLDKTECPIRDTNIHCIQCISKEGTSGSVNATESPQGGTKGTGSEATCSKALKSPLK